MPKATNVLLSKDVAYANDPYEAAANGVAAHMNEMEGVLES